MRNALLWTLGLLAPVPLAPAQKVGDPAPDVVFQTRFNFGKIKAGKLSQLRGSAVLLEFWGTH